VTRWAISCSWPPTASPTPRPRLSDSEQRYAELCARSLLCERGACRRMGVKPDRWAIDAYVPRFRRDLSRRLCGRSSSDQCALSRRRARLCARERRHRDSHHHRCHREQVSSSIVACGAPGLESQATPAAAGFQGPKLRNVVMIGSRLRRFVPQREFDASAQTVDEASVHRARLACGCATWIDALYVGTTANPKGCLITHEAQVRIPSPSQHRYRLTHEDRFGRVADVSHRLGASHARDFRRGAPTSP